MPPALQWNFGFFRLDRENACLWHDAEMVGLRPKKTFAVLHNPIAHAGQLVTKEALFEAVWPDTAVGDAVLKVCINAMRKALGNPRHDILGHRRFG
jgi:DNA-binding winged helix-turn-helix (wHTH) protein